MKAKLTLTLLNALETTGATYEVHDTTVTGLFVRVTAAGHKAYVVTWGRAKKRTLGRVGVLTLDQARKEALQYLAEAREHGEPLAVTQGRRSVGALTLREFIDEHYLPWFKNHHKGHDKTRHTLDTSFTEVLTLRIDEITGRHMEQVRGGWVKSGNKPATCNRKMGAISGVFSRAVEWGHLAASPLEKVKQLRVDSKSRIRYLLPEEEKRLRLALDDRQEATRADRDSANKWREERGKEPLPDLKDVAFSDHLKPLVLISLNTGMRRGEVFNLTWADIDLKNKIITVDGDTSKSGQTRHIPMNREALATIEAWKDQHTRDSGYVFPGRDGKRLDNVNTSWEGVLKLAKVTGFRWHDLRHTFASKLVMAGVPLNTVRDLLGHSDLAMTLRYAHLAPDSKASAVELI